ncbi:helicase C-terminal domain-containing protein [Collybia nuda]|uniref:ATP-dependent DNA helicase CHL1 n=1 Tax=Collybia nuda TaxID=64659 RepID=A0A9P6CJN5_9AGAR|nr:helicase C-terminal domain-containing protein [Collybia nuda]
MPETIKLTTPSSFPAFPFNPPYEIQVELMRHLYSTIEEKKVTIIESPTGTGKTLSLLCASLTWLADDKDRARKGKLDAFAGEDDGAKDWVIEQTRERVRRELEADERDYEDRLRKARNREALIKRKANARVVKRPRFDPKPGRDDDIDDDRFLPEIEAQGDTEDMNISPALRALMAKVDKPSKPGYLDNEVEPTCTKIYYASRTHSQLAQVLPELRRLKLKLQINSHHPQNWGVAVASGKRGADGSDDDEDTPAPHSRAVSLGSRKQLCINDELRARARDLDEGCRELLAEKRDKRCPYLPPIGEDTRMLDFRDQILASPKDIEDLAAVGKMIGTCPYYGSRRAIPQAELVTLPYNLLLQRTAREALGIDLTDQIVIIDEAHNLIPTLLSISTTRLPFSTLTTSLQQVGIYVSKFRNRLGAENMLHLRRLVVFLDALKRYTLEWKDSRRNNSAVRSQETHAGEKAEIMTVAELLERLGRKAAGVNLMEIEAYLRRSKVARKIAGYSDKETRKNGNGDHLQMVKRGAVPPLHVVEAFLISLTGNNEDGRVTFSLYEKPDQEGIEIKYQLLNPSPQFQDVVDVARSVILAGGTMSPISDVVNQLFSYLPQEKLSSFSCGHIIPSSSLLTLVVTKGPRGGELDYKARKQGNSAVIAELGQILLNFVGIIPGGMIVFFPSYNFLNAAKVAWKSTDYLGKISVKKKIFFEPEEAAEVDRVLQEYSAAIQINTRGALLFAVIGAKLSEGLNFADDLARAVVVVGVPFANLGSPELRERMDYVKQLENKRGPKKGPGQKNADAELYENMCMNAVNQSIGRAIRHQGDWASLILLDSRYASSSIRNKLPKWIGSGITITDGFGQVVNGLGTFYRSKRT